MTYLSFMPAGIRSEAGSGDTPGAIRDLAVSFDRMSYPIMEISALAAVFCSFSAEDLHKTFDLALGFVALAAGSLHCPRPTGRCAILGRTFRI
ncbi:hypothetical protein ACU8M5_25430 (plasmid) [Rhizobium leguminosarum]